MKKIINSPDNVVIEACKGIVSAHPELAFIEKYKVIKKKDVNTEKVSLISGGGSGHEPAHAGFVGKGMLDAAVCGDVFASPSTIQVYNAITATASNRCVPCNWAATACSNCSAKNTCPACLGCATAA